MKETKNLIYENNEAKIFEHTFYTPQGFEFNTKALSIIAKVKTKINGTWIYPNKNRPPKG